MFALPLANARTFVDETSSSQFI